MKKLVFFVLLFSLTACVAPPAITVASLAISGVSYLETGKTLPDHALSSVSQRDCLVFRAARGEQICQVGEAPALAATAEPVIEVAAGPGIEDGAPWYARTATPPAAPVATVTVAALAPPPANSAGQPARQDVRWAPPAADLAAITRLGAGVAPPKDAGASRVANTAVDPALFVPMIPGDVIAPPERVAMAQTPVLAPVLPPVRVVAAAAGPQRHLVVGSFRDRARAETHIANLADPDLRIVAAEVKGRTQYRVVTGPLAQADLPGAKRAYAGKGIKGAWAIFLEQSDAPIQLAAN